MSPSARWSNVEVRSDMLARHSERSLYYGPGLGGPTGVHQAASSRPARGF
jgi:hypothetical protein